ncbi:MAG TPA: hypothetical protein PK691_03330, partial [Thermomicrobiales bacterium]|nr:hypothetical protein [Thermomicrobiales bacterium]
MPQDPEDFDDSPIAGAPLRGLSTRRTVLSAFGASAVLAPAALAESGLHADPTAPLRQGDSVDLDKLIKQLRKQDAPAVAAAIVAALATVGVPVFASEGDAEPITAVAGTELPLAVSLTQVRAMATELVAGTGLFGTDLDDLTGAPAEGMASTSLLLAAWTRSIDSTGAILARGIMGKRNWKRYEQLRYPNLVQLLFAADIVRDSVEAGNATLSRRNLLASVGPIMPLRRPRFEATVCGTMSGFVDSMLNAVVNALKFTVGEGEQGTVSGFFKDLWNGVVDLATTAAKKVLDSLTAPVVNVIKSIAVALSIGISVLTYLKPWEIVISFDQEPTRFGLG